MTTLPELEHELISAARRGARPRRLRGHRLGVLLAGTTLAAGGAATAATQLLTVDEGSTARGAYVIERISDRDGNVCLQYRDETGRRATSGCGPRPSEQRPIGLVVADSRAVPNQRVVYGLVSPSVARISVLGRGDDHVDVTSHARDGIPGRYFMATVPNTPRIELVAYDAEGREIGRLGSREQAVHAPRSKEEAIAQGDPSGFAPTAAPVDAVEYRGQRIEPDEAARRGLSCTEDDIEIRCYDSAAEMEAAETTRADPSQP
jgi:hypothetical protein